MKTLHKLGMGVLALALSSTALIRGNAKPLHNSVHHKLPTTTYILHAAMRDDGPGTGGTENYTIISFITNTTDTTYADRLTIDQTVDVWWDRVGDGFHADIIHGTNQGTYTLDNYLPPHSTFPILFSNISYSPGTLDGETITLDETHVTYL